MAEIIGINAAQNLMTRFGTLEALAQSSIPRLCQNGQLTGKKARTLKAAFALAKLLSPRDSAPVVINNAVQAAAVLRAHFESLHLEHVRVLLLDPHNQLLQNLLVASGSVDRVCVSPQTLFRVALQFNAASLIVAHNHPSGNPSPTEADLKLAERINNAGNIIGIRCQDFLIFSSRHRARASDYVSFLDQGIMPNQ
ncbi:MAG: hypothetical protein H7246_15315 [Phycisphaerae bacterium]|nr:hypothetical protein [Saprospiraceae bacterium]